MSAGIDIRQALQDAGGTLVTGLPIIEHLRDTAGDIVTTGSTTMELWRVNLTDGTLAVYDFDAGARAFVTSSPTTRTTALTHRQAAGVDTGIWTVVLDQHAVNAMADPSIRGLFIVQVSNASAAPIAPRMFQFGDVDGDGLIIAQLAATDGASAYGTALETPAESRANAILDATSELDATLSELIQVAIDAQVVHTTTISNALSTGGNPPVTVTLTSGVASGVKAGQVVVISHELGGKSVWRVTTDSAGTTLVLQGASEGVAGVTIGDTVYVLAANNLTELISTGNASAATAVTQTTAGSIRTAVGLASANLDSQIGAVSQYAASADTNAEIAATEVAKVPRSATALTAGGGYRKTKVAATVSTLDETIGETP